MNKEVISALTSGLVSNVALLHAEPQSLEIDQQSTAVIVIDMQNAFVSKGGMYELRGIDISGCQKIIEPIRQVIRAAHVRGIKVVYIVTRYSPDLHEGGSPNSPNWYKGTLTTYHKHPEWGDKLLTRHTWGADVVRELKPDKDDIVIEKARYNAFFRTNLDDTLKNFNIKYLLFTGVATNVCVEATIRDAYYHDYFPILISDAVANTGPQFIQEATIFNVKRYYGWVTTTEDAMKAIRSVAAIKKRRAIQEEKK
jgi:ureidoacrylate peracid hydrolase